MIKNKKGRPNVAEKTTLKCYKVCSNYFQQVYQESTLYWNTEVLEKIKFHTLKN